LEELNMLSPEGGCAMNAQDKAKTDDAAVQTAVADVHCRERGIATSSDQGVKIASVVKALVNTGIQEPDDLRAALSDKER